MAVTLCSFYAGYPLVKQTKAHVLVRLLRLFLLLLLLGLSRGGATSGGGSCSSCRRGTGRAADVGHQLLDVDALQGLREQAWPVRLNTDASSLEDGGQLVSRDGDLIVSKDQCGINTRQLVVGSHYFCFTDFLKSPKGLSKMNKRSL